MPVLYDDSVAPVRLGFVPSLTHPLRDRIGATVQHDFSRYSACQKSFPKRCFLVYKGSFALSY
jgi:hypothetical protein